ncbi:MAG: hypothetical protein IPP41_07155 [Rhodocyclaceae bacterium]|nr:hypothetical protein [Rhodocyclaceae bacterium]
MKTKFLMLCAACLLNLTATGMALAAVPVTEEPGHIVRYRSARFVLYTNNFAPGDWTLYHEHRNDLLAVIAGETIAISQKLGGEPGEQKVPAGTVAFFPYADMTDGYVHRVSVSGTKPFINIGVDFQEIAPSAERRALVPTWSSKFAKLIAENRRGRAYRIELDPGQALVIPDNGSALLVVALSTATIIFSNATTDASPWESNMGDFKFFESARPQQLSNASANGASLIVFQAY